MARLTVEPDRGSRSLGSLASECHRAELVDTPVSPLTAFRRLDLLLGRAVDLARQRYGERAGADEFRGLYVTLEQASAPLDGAVGVPLAAGVPIAEHDAVPGWVEICATHRGWRWLRDRYALRDLDLDLVLVALAPEADLRYERLYGYLQDDVTRRRPTVDLALDVLTTSAEDKLAARQSLCADASLVTGRVVRLVPEERAVPPPLLAHTITVDEQVADLLLGQAGLDRRLADWCTLLEPNDRRPRSASCLSEADHAALVATVRAAWGHRPQCLLFHGRPGSGRGDTAAAVAADLGVPLLVADASRCPVGDGEGLQLALREAELQGALLYIQGADSDAGLHAVVAAGLDEIAAHRGTVVLAVQSPWLAPGGPVLGELRVSFTDHDVRVRREAWLRGLAAVPVESSDIDHLVSRYRLLPGHIAAASAVALEMARSRSAAAGDPEPASPTRAELAEAARRQSGHGLADQARLVRPRHGWSDLVLPEPSLLQLRELCERVVLRDHVLAEWGLAERLVGSRGCAALFVGPPGTGKTMAAEVIAAELGLDLYVIDLARVVSKYIGETERNLERIFAAAEQSDAVLFFDEADALFGKRSEVHDAHDRYANIETAYLLQRMEQYDGVALLATNLRGHLDDAFTRRLQFVIDFPFPDEDLRRKIWSVCIPPVAPVDADVDLSQLARDSRLAGGNIRNAVVHAAYRAAARASPIAMDDLVQAARREHQKMGKTPRGAESTR